MNHDMMMAIIGGAVGSVVTLIVVGIGAIIFYIYVSRTVSERMEQISDALDETDNLGHSVSDSLKKQTHWILKQKLKNWDQSNRSYEMQYKSFVQEQMPDILSLMDDAKKAIREGKFGQAESIFVQIAEYAYDNIDDHLDAPKPVWKIFQHIEELRAIIKKGKKHRKQLENNRQRKKARLRVVSSKEGS